MVLVKKYWILTATAVLLSALFLFLPAMTDGLVTRVVLTRPAAVSAASDILVSGIVEQQTQTELYPEIPVVIEEVLADPGDTVSAGQPIATVDLNATKNALVSLLEAVEVIPEEYLAAFSNVHVDESMLSAVIPETLSAPASGTLLTSSLSPGQLGNVAVSRCRYREGRYAARKAYRSGGCYRNSQGRESCCIQNKRYRCKALWGNRHPNLSRR